MRYVVTGGSGFVGSHLVDLLLDRDSEVVVVDKISNYDSVFERSSNVKLKTLYMDLTNIDLVNKMLRKDDVVIHLAAQSHVDVSFRMPVETTYQNVISAHCLLEACIKNEVKKLIIMSTDEVYGSTNVINGFNTLDPANPYSASKAAVDMIANAYVHMYPDFTIATLRSNNIAGPRQFVRNIIPRFSLLALANRKMTLHGDGSATRRYLWVKDAANALLLLADRCEESSIFNIGHDKSYTNLEIANKIASYLNVRDHVSFEKDRLINDVFYPPSDGSMEQKFGWRVTKELDDFLPETIEWYRENFENLKKHI